MPQGEIDFIFLFQASLASTQEAATAARRPHIMPTFPSPLPLCQHTDASPRTTLLRIGRRLEMLRTLTPMRYYVKWPTVLNEDIVVFVYIRPPPKWCLLKCALRRPIEFPSSRRLNNVVLPVPLAFPVYFCWIK